MKKISEIKIDVKKYEYKKEIKNTDKESFDIYCFYNITKNNEVTEEELLSKILECKRYLKCYSKSKEINMLLERVRKFHELLVNRLRRKYLHNINENEELIELYKKKMTKYNNPFFKNNKIIEILKQENMNMLFSYYGEFKKDEIYYEADEEILYPYYEDVLRKYNDLINVEQVEKVKKKQNKNSLESVFKQISK